MADVKISGLPASTVPLAGTEVLPIVQGGQTRQVSVNNLTTGKAVSATQYTSTIVTGTAPLVVASTTEVANLRSANATSADTANQVKSNATTGVLQVAGPSTGTTRVMTTPDANFTAARTDSAQTFTGTQTFGAVTATGGAVNFSGATSYSNSLTNAGYTPQYTGATCRGIEVSSGNSDSGTFGVFARQQASSATTTDNRGVSIQGYSGYFGANVTDLYNAKQPLINLTQEYQRFLAGNGRALPQLALYMGYSDGATRVDYARRFLFASTGDLTLDTGNLVIGTSGKGIDFSATPGTGTSELLADYERGTWTPTGNNITYTAASGTYVKVGALVTVYYSVTFPVTVDATQARLGGLPYVSANTTLEVAGGVADLIALVDGNTYGRFMPIDLTLYTANATLSGLTIIGQISYEV